MHTCSLRNPDGRCSFMYGILTFVHPVLTANVDLNVGIKSSSRAGWSSTSIMPTVSKRLLNAWSLSVRHVSCHDNQTTAARMTFHILQTLAPPHMSLSWCIRMQICTVVSPSAETRSTFEQLRSAAEVAATADILPRVSPLPTSVIDSKVQHAKRPEAVLPMPSTTS